MKYCPKCKLRMPGEGQTCTKCGGPLRVIGPADPGDRAGSESPPEELLLTLQGLEHQVQRSRKLASLMGLVAAGLTVLLLVVVIWMHFYHVSQYATIDRIEILPSASSPGAAEIKFVKLSPGKVEFVRESAGKTETLTDHIGADEKSADPERKFIWGGNRSEDYTIWVKYRSGWGVAEREWSSRDKLQSPQ